MNLMVLRPDVVIPYRWVGHGRDVRVCRVDGAWRYVADDLEPIIGPLHLIADVVMTPGEILDVDIAGVELATISRGHVAMWLAAAPLTDDIDDFRTWFARLSAELDGTAESVLAAATHPEPAATAQHLYQVADAARILSRAPGVEIGPIQLFKLMHRLGWIERDDAQEWTPTEAGRRAGYLTTRPMRIGDSWTAHYLQVVLAEAALTELQRVLGGSAPLALDAPTPTPTLVEL